MKKLAILSAAVMFALGGGAAVAKVSEAEAAKLGTSLTPMGGEMAASADGSIPAWNGGITAAPAGYKKGDHHPDPYSADKVEYTVTKANLEQYKKIGRAHV